MARQAASGASDLDLWELEEREADRLGLTSYPCPCRIFLGGRCISRATIRKHLRTIGRDPQFTVPILASLVDAENDPVEEEVTESPHLLPEEEARESPHVLDKDNGGMDAIRMIMECLSRYDNLEDEHSEECTPTDDDKEDDDIPCEERDWNEEVMEELKEHARTPLYAGATTSRLVSTLLLLNYFAVFGVSNAFADELLQLLHILLPSDNYLPRSHYEARKYVVKLGLSYHIIHVCRNGCCLFRKELKDEKFCPKPVKSRTIQNPPGPVNNPGYSASSEEHASKEEFGRDEEAEVPEYERLRQLNIKKNSLKLQDLGVLKLAASLNSSRTTDEAPGGEGNHAFVKPKRNPCNSDHKKSLKTVSRDSKAGLDEPCRRIERLKKNKPPIAGRTRSARKKQKAISHDSSSKDWHSEDDTSNTADDFENDNELGGNGEDLVRIVGVGRRNRGNKNPQGRRHSSEPSVWELRKRGPRDCAITKSTSTGLHPQQTTRPQPRNRIKMSEDTLVQVGVWSHLR